MAFETLAVRAASTIVLAPLFVWVTVVGGLPFLLIMGIVALVGMVEFNRMARSAGLAPDLPLACFGSIAIFASAWQFGVQGAALVITLFPSLLILRYVAGDASGKAIVNSGLTLYSVLHFAYFTCFLYLLRETPGRELAALICLLVLVWIQDSAAYLVGSACGRTPLTPISPKKTWEGTTAGLILGVAAGLATLHFGFGRPLSITSAAVLTAIGLLAQLGDLSESLMKRNFGVKDSGNIIPGHGGMLDRFDSLSFSAPAMYILYPWT